MTLENCVRIMGTGIPQPLVPMYEARLILPPTLSLGIRAVTVIYMLIPYSTIKELYWYDVSFEYFLWACEGTLHRGLTMRWDTSEMTSEFATGHEDI